MADDAHHRWSRSDTLFVVAVVLGSAACIHVFGVLVFLTVLSAILLALSGLLVVLLVKISRKHLLLCKSVADLGKVIERAAGQSCFPREERAE